MIDVSKLRKVLQFIDDNPELHDQSEILKKTTDCGTIGCLAGHTVMMFGDYHVLWCRVSDSGLLRAAEVLRLDGRKAGILDEAQRILGLSEEQADRLFDSDITFAEMWNLADKWTDGEVFREKATQYSQEKGIRSSA